jgi:AcrR family transcriptional regulator
MVGKKQAKEDAHERILAAAEKLFAARGYSAASVQDITDMAGINKAMLYYYFRSKENLYRRLIEQGSESLGHAMEEALKGKTTEQRLRRFLTAYSTMMAARPGLTQIVYREVLGYGSDNGPNVRSELIGYIGRLQQLIEAGQESGELKPMDPSLAAYSLFGMSNIFITAHLTGSRPLDVPSTVEHTVNLFLHGAAAK